MKRTLVFVAAAALLGIVGVYGYTTLIGNPRIESEIIASPDGERARKVMLITLPSGRRLPVNYLREGDLVFAGADGRWWKELEEGSHPVSVFVRGETLLGHARAVLDEPDYVADVFARLRPNAIEGFGTLIEIRLDTGGATDSDTRTPHQ